ncbi:hypothetical protein BCR33DRAFT_783101 [Rhizoclosmatium globosum]|uniref:Uncharacterized protein n=1 Tax=Rhizoclosmatium globosum TaxID=329046 RepID=A0A1Y2CK23_9FUNG|nr:hypothetical protein BCR33DRAFT_783101 [Rhizoclosmatium globosum]|eukprot:ORY47362.1 hypothetical protein BCR33DRAFT_783101 [Rhizoclosmatium globosum]
MKHSSSTTPASSSHRDPSNFGATEFHADVEAQAELALFLRTLIDGDTTPKGTDVKDACPALRKYETPTLNSKIRQFWQKLKRDKNWNPADDQQPMVLGNVGSSDSVAGRSNGISVGIRTTASAKRLRLLENGSDPDEADGEGDLHTEDLEQLLNCRPLAVPRPKPLATFSSANLCPAASANSTQASTAVKLAYTRLGNQNSQFNSNFRMHEVFDGVDGKSLSYCYILICLLTVMRWEVNIVGDRKVLNYAFWPKTMNPSDFIDRKHPEFENAEPLPL